MSKSKGNAQQQHPAWRPPPRRGVDTLDLATLAGVVAVLMISFSNWREIDRIQETLDNRLAQIENRIAEVANRAPAAAQPLQRGPDPNRVYEIRTAGAPVKGPATAAVTIAEFSDFQ